MKLLLYCTKDKPYLYKQKVDNTFTLFLTKKKFYQLKHLNGKVVGECDYEIEKITYKDNNYYFEFKHAFDSLRESCLSFTELDNYLNQNSGYAIHIKSLKVFDEPRPTKWFGYTDKKGYLCSVEKAPQNMMYCYDEFGNDYVLISIHPEWLRKILSGEKTIEVRKKVLKGMIKNGK